MRIPLRRALQVLAGLLILSLIALLVVSLQDSGQAAAFRSSVDAGQRPAAPALDIEGLTGSQRIDLQALKGHWVVVNFWASWCAACQDEAPLLVELQRNIAPKGGVVVGVDVQDLTDDARAFAKRFQMTYPLGHDPANTGKTRWGVDLLPETFVVDPTGHVVYHVPGTLSEAEVAKITRMVK